ncbi:hypothetical protein [Sorangium sp. So ce693]|uniref:hypothetical protein n=1 Tax=Sorangium sp. So ce693 TaxID=3133318 RepID=UPI003F5DA25F
MALKSNPALRNLQGLEGVSQLANLLVIGNAKLESLEGLSALETVYQDLTIGSNAVLTSIDGLSALRAIDQNLIISNNPELTSLDGLSSLERIHYGLEITTNPKLPTCEAEELRERTGVPQASVINNDDSATCP